MVSALYDRSASIQASDGTAATGYVLATAPDRAVSDRECALRAGQMKIECEYALWRVTNR